MGFAEDKDTEVHETILQKPFHQQVAHDDVPEAWSTGLCDCCSKPGGAALCCVSFLLPYVQYGVLSEQLPEGSFPLAGSFCGAAIPFALLDVAARLAYFQVVPGINLIPTNALMHLFMRRHIRRKYNIKGNWFSDLCTAWWCAPCALAQETRELVIRGAARDANTSFTPSGPAGSASAAPPPAPVCMVGNLVMPATPVYGNAFAPNFTAAPAPAAAPTAPVAPATGIPVPAVATTHVATVTLGQADVKASAAAN